MCTSHCGAQAEGRQQLRVVRVLQSLCPSDMCVERHLTTNAVVSDHASYLPQPYGWPGQRSPLLVRSLAILGCISNSRMNSVQPPGAFVRDPLRNRSVGCPCYQEYPSGAHSSLRLLAVFPSSYKQCHVAPLIVSQASGRLSLLVRACATRR